MISSQARFSLPFASSIPFLGLPQRLTLFVLLFAAEWIPLSDRVHQGLGLGSLFQLAVVSGAFFLGLLFVQFKDLSQRVSNDLQSAPIGWGFLASHCGVFLGAVCLAFLPLGTSLSGSRRYVIATLCCTAAAAAIGLASGLARWPEPARIAWLAVRTTAAVVTVPIAEELAFRCFLIRRLISRDFQSLSPREYSVAAVLISSMIFGVLHGDRWLAGLGAGLVYAFVFLRRGSTGDAVMAHATTNALLAVCL